jgi:hypothetical protein
MPIGMTKNERLYAALETTYGTAATLAAADCVRHISCKFSPIVAKLVREDKTGARSKTAGDVGRKSATWESSHSLVTSGVAGTLADLDPFFVCLMGTAGVVKTGTSTITAATNVSPIVITAASHGLATGDMVNITGVLGNTAANGAWFVTVTDANTFSLIGSTGNGAWTSGGTINKAAVKYALSDVIRSMTIGHFITPASLEQQLAIGSVVKTGKFTLGQDVAKVDWTGESKWITSSLYFSDSNADAEMKAGLSAFPTEPASPVTSGGLIPGYKGKAILGGSLFTKVTSTTINFTTGNEIPHDYFGTDYGQDPEGDVRSITVDASITAEDTAAQALLYKYALEGTPIDVAMQLGIVPGSIVGIYCKGVQLPVPELDSTGKRFIRNFSGAEAHGSSASSLDDITIWML